MKFDDFWRKNIFEGQVFFSATNTLNDPYDCLIYVNREEYGKYILKEIQMLFPMINKKLLREETIKCLEDGRISVILCVSRYVLSRTQITLTFHEKLIIRLDYQN